MLKKNQNKFLDNKMYFKKCINCSVVFVLMASQSAIANQFSDTFHGQPKLNLNVYAFAADVDGDISKGNIDYEVDQPFKDTLKELDQSFMAHLELNKGKWGIYADKQYVKTSQDKLVFNIPLALNTKLDQSSYGVYYQAYVSPEQTKDNYSKFIVEPTIGMHQTDASATLSVLNNQVKTSADWDEFFWGARFKYNFNSPWNLASELSFGVENTRSAQAYLGYRIPVFDRNLNIRAGYRYFEQDYKSNDFKWDIKQHGPVIGINLPIF